MTHHEAARGCRADTLANERGRERHPDRESFEPQPARGMLALGPAGLVIHAAESARLGLECVRSRLRRSRLGQRCPRSPHHG